MKLMFLNLVLTLVTLSSATLAEPNKPELDPSEQANIKAKALCEGNPVCEDRLNQFIIENARTPATDAENCDVYFQIKSKYCNDQDF